MAPNKKKKKLAANAARGFATTSVVSKSKAQEPDVETAEETLVTTAQEAADAGPSFNAPAAPLQNVDTDFTHLTPEELEARLEESELQLLVEKHADKVKKDALRQTSRLQTEKRLLRSQAERLSLAHWLPDELVDLILSHPSARQLDVPVSLETSSRRLSTEDLSNKLWTLAKTLAGLGISTEYVQGAVTHVLRQEVSGLRAANDYSKDALWGLEEALDWLASRASYEDLPDYETGLVRSQKVADYPADIRFDELKKNSKRNNTGGLTPQDDEPHSDDNVEPQELLNRYLELQTRLFKHQPELTTIENPRLAKTKSRKTQKEQQSGDADIISKRLLSRISRLQRDLLFDREEAYEKWGDLRIQLLREAAERKRLQLDEGPTATPAESSVASSEAQPTPTPSEDEDGEDGIGLGEFFRSLPEVGIDVATRTSNIVASSANGESVTIRSFGTWRGLSPRKILEEACKARDSSASVSYRTTSASNFSVRMALIVRWSKDQEVPLSSVLPIVETLTNPRALKVEMKGISTPDTNQAEAYVSTMAIFLVFYTSQKEKIHLRLPPVWRDFWEELAAIRNAEVDAVDRLELKGFRQMVEDQNGEMGDNTTASERALHATVVTADMPESRQLNGRLEEEAMTPADAISLWRAKSSSPRFQSMLKSRSTLPIWSFKSELLESIAQHQVVIVCGETGCGKSTQVPSLILEEELANGRPCKIYCAEPRRISAISLARRVSEELGEYKNDVGTARSLVGYAIRLESQVTRQTRLIFATTGILMRMLERADDLADITHLILDEVHERTIDSDFLLIVLRRLMVKRPKLRVILMSATVNAEQFSRYLDGAPILNVPGRTYPVQTLFLEDAIEVTGYRRHDDPSKRDLLIEDDDEDDKDERETKASAKADLKGYSANTRNVLATLDEYRIDYSLILALLETIATAKQYAAYSKAILIFLPGIAEIRRLHDTLAGHRRFSHDWHVYPLHSAIPTEQQEQAFLVPPPGIRKIVLATNIAETGITIPDVTCVLDTGLHREMRFDERRQLSRLIQAFISRANAKQRRGRAGRVQDGLCFHLFTRGRHDAAMAEQQTPEMLRLSLQDLVLRVKIMKLGGAEEILAEALDPPLAKNVRRAMESLVDVGALRGGERLTPLGRQLAKLPLDVFLGKLILLGSIFQCLDAALTIAAILSSKSPFSAPLGARAQADLARLAFKKGDSDLLTIYNAYCAWRRVCTTTTTAAGSSSSSSSSEAHFCRKNFLSPQTLQSIEELKAQLTACLVDAGFLQLSADERAALGRARAYAFHRRTFVRLPPAATAHDAEPVVVTSVVAWAFYPKLLVRDGKGWRNAANNQAVGLHPSSVNKGLAASSSAVAATPPSFLSFYHIMQSGSGKAYHAHETSPVEALAVALACGEAEFRTFAGVLVLDGHRFRFKVDGWRQMRALRLLRGKVGDMVAARMRAPGRGAGEEEEGFWWGVWARVFVREGDA